MSKVSKIHCTDFNALNGMFVRDVEDGVCGFYATLYAEYRFMSKMSKMSKILCIQWPLAPPGGKAHCSCPTCGFSGSPPCSPRRQLCKLSWTCHTTRVIAGKTHSQSPILKTKGAQQPGNSYISMGTMVHPPHSNRTCHKQII